MKIDRFIIILSLVFFVFLGNHQIAKATECNDGTTSTSVGKGTCSWHGGVVGNSDEDHTGVTTWITPIDPSSSGISNNSKIAKCDKWRGTDEGEFIDVLKFPGHALNVLLNSNTKESDFCNPDGSHEGKERFADIFSGIFAFFLANGLILAFFSKLTKNMPKY